MWSNIRWQWWQWFVLGICHRNTTWFHDWSRRGVVVGLWCHIWATLWILPVISSSCSSYENTRRKTLGIGRHVFGYQFVRVNFFVSLETLENKPVCHIYQWVAHPTHGAVCNHCDRMMDGHTLDDLIFQRGEHSLTEDEVVAYVRR